MTTTTTSPRPAKQRRRKHTKEFKQEMVRLAQPPEVGFARAAGFQVTTGGPRPRPGPANLFNITTKLLTVRDMTIGAWLDRQALFQGEVGGHYRAGRIKNLG